MEQQEEFEIIAVMSKHKDDIGLPGNMAWPRSNHVLAVAWFLVCACFSGFRSIRLFSMEPVREGSEDASGEP